MQWWPLSGRARRRRPPQTLFLLGVARSGTTALANLLGRHPEVIVGQERFKRLLLNKRLGELTPDLFGHDRFFDFADDLTNVVPERSDWAKDHYDRMEAKWDTARYVGDKLTTVRVQELRRQHPEAQYVIIVRDIAEVAASWDKRAHSTSDHWKSDQDAAKAVRKWNTLSKRTVTVAQRWPDQVSVVEYSTLYGDPDATSFKALLARLGLEFAPVAEAFAATHRTYVESIRDKERSVDPELLALADQETWQELRRIAL